MPRYARISVIAALVAAISAIGLVSPAMAAGSQPVYSNAIAVDAPRGGKGGIQTPFVYCPNYEQKPRVRVRIESETTGYTYTYRWRGALPVVGFPRVEPGRYEVRTKATCGTTTKTWVESVEVKEKTAERTVSPAEWRRVKRGMTLERVREIIGYSGQLAGNSYGGASYRTYEMMPFWRYSILEFRHGRVVSKLWNAAHD